MRIQILELPTDTSGETAMTPFIIIVSECPDPRKAAAPMTDENCKHTGARAVWFFSEPVVLGPPSAYEQLQERAETKWVGDEEPVDLKLFADAIDYYVKTLAAVARVPQWTIPVRVTQEDVDKTWAFLDDDDERFVKGTD